MHFTQIYINLSFEGKRKGTAQRMYEKKSYFLILLFATSVIFTGCRSNDDPEPEYIVIDDGTINQNVYADKVADESGVRITTLAPWSSSIREVTTTLATRNTVDWVSISPDRGNIGTYIIMYYARTELFG